MLALTDKIQADLESHEIIPKAIEPLSGGRNNRVWKITLESGENLLLKHYLPDEWPRLRHEKDFLVAAQQAGAPAPRLVATLSNLNYALIEFIEGERPNTSLKTIQAAAQFILTLRTGHAKLVPAKDAQFHAEGHFEKLRERTAKLPKIDQNKPHLEEAWELGMNEIIPLAQELETCLQNEREALTIDLTQGWPSPSDFGLHNSLQRPNGEIVFFDFEYAGLDDPAKLIVDFCYQPDNILPEELKSVFQTTLFEAAGKDKTSLKRRTELLTPLYQLKWACICLNRFLPSAGLKENFQATQLDPATAQIQIAKAKKMVELARISFPKS